MQFLNVDLEIWSAAKLDPMAAEMGKRVSVLHCGPSPKRNLLAVETATLRSQKDPDSAIHALCTVVESLSPGSRRVWQKARKVFDVGYETESFERLSRFSLRPDTVDRVAKLKAGLAFSYYQRNKSDV
jgi:hypothetical protein